MELRTYQPMNPTNLLSLGVTEWILNGLVPAYYIKGACQYETPIPPLFMPLDVSVCVHVCVGVCGCVCG